MYFFIRIQVILFLLIIPVKLLYAQDFSAGARSRSMGNACIADTNVWAILTNPAGVSHIKKASVLVSDEYLYNLQEIRSFSTATIIPVKKKFIIGFTFQKQGYTWFNDQQIGLHVAQKINIYSLGASFMLWQRVAGETFKQTHPLFNIGGTMSLNKYLQLGLHFSNCTNTQNDLQNLPVSIQAGVMYMLSKEIIWYTDLKKQLNSEITFQTGIEYKIHKNFLLRSGVQLKPMRLNGGIGFLHKRTATDYSISYQSLLGFRHQLSLCVFLSKRHE
jgi:long-subunit fatty acid transport protein